MIHAEQPNTGMEFKNISVGGYDFGPKLNTEQQAELDHLNSLEAFDWNKFDQLTEGNSKIVTKILDHPNYEHENIQLSEVEQVEFDHLNSLDAFDWAEFDRLTKKQ